MAEAELIVKFGQLDFQARGPQEWVSEQRKIIFDGYMAENPNLDAASTANEVDAQKEQVTGGSNLRVVDRWIKQHGLADHQLDQVYDRMGDAPELIVGKAPGDKGRDQVVNVYLLAGIKEFLGTGEAGFQDKEARAFCEKLGCFDSKHHAEYLKGAGNRIVGSKEQGWRLTAPGFVAAADVIKHIATA